MTTTIKKEQLKSIFVMRALEMQRIRERMDGGDEMPLDMIQEEIQDCKFDITSEELIELIMELEKEDFIAEDRIEIGCYALTYESEEELTDEQCKEFSKIYYREY